MIKRITIAFAALLLLNVNSRSQDALEIHMWSEQHVLITGEAVWFDGILNTAAYGGKSIVVRLIDRNGQSRAEVEVVPDQFRFNGYIFIPESFASDYYFLDGYVKGKSTNTRIAPVMVINPRIPPSPHCTVNTPPVTLPAPLAITVSKNSVPPRGMLTISADPESTVGSVNVTALRYDLLDETYATAASDQPLILQHNAAGSPETEGTRITATTIINGAPAKGIRLMASIKGDKTVIATAVTNELGTAEFILPLSYAQGMILISPINARDKNAVISTEALLVPNTPIAFPCLQLIEAHRKDIEARMFNSAVSGRFFGNRLINVEVPERDTSDFYGKPDVRFLLDDYVRFPNMEEVISEIIPQLRVRKPANGPILQVLNQPLKNFFEEEPLILVDGVPISNTKALLESDPLLVRSIEIVSRKYIQGTTEFNGVVHFRTYKGDRMGLPAASIISFPFKGIQENATYNAADHGKKIDRMPDMRNLVFREAGLTADQIKKGIRLYAPDAEGKYRIVVRGLTASGEWIHGFAIIEVKAD